MGTTTTTVVRRRLTTTTMKVTMMLRSPRRQQQKQRRCFHQLMPGRKNHTRKADREIPLLDGGKPPGQGVVKNLRNDNGDEEENRKDQEPWKDRLVQGKNLLLEANRRKTLPSVSFGEDNK